ncbi:MAG: TrmH family RNA methyltransferase, partial [Candidatus Colwellbacteria bacterium]|nr:TrmH family RNA methyltransferase [Candidatus Colwellbacteria bacterium]
IWLCGVTPTPLDKFGRSVSDIAKCALGAEKNISWEKADSVVRTINKLKKDGWHIIAIEQRGDSVRFNRFDYSSHEKTVLILGNEVDGLPKKVLDIADDIIEIPMFGGKESLNVSVAFGVVAYAWRMADK